MTPRIAQLYRRKPLAGASAKKDKLCAFPPVFSQQVLIMSIVVLRPKKKKRQKILLKLRKKKNDNMRAVFSKVRFLLQSLLPCLVQSTHRRGPKRGKHSYIYVCIMMYTRARERTRYTALLICNRVCLYKSERERRIERRKKTSYIDWHIHRYNIRVVCEFYIIIK